MIGDLVPLRPLLLSAVLTAATTAGPTMFPGSASAASPAKPFDVDGDGRRDVVVGAPDYHRHEGAVIVDRSGSGASQLIRLPRPELAPDAPRFGSSVTSADFDRDGFADLAVGAPADHPTAESLGGTVTIYHGSASGVTGPVSRLVSGATGAGSPTFGTEVVAGNIDRDGYPDLVLGGSGITVAWGGPAGFHTTRLIGVSTNDTRSGLGAVLATGDVNGDDWLDVVYGCHDERTSGGVPTTACASGLLLGGPSGLRATERFQEPDVGEIAIGDVSDDGFDDVVLGEGGFHSKGAAGRVVVYLGGRGGVRDGTRSVIKQSTRGVPGTQERHDRFGAAVTTSDTDRDGRLDLLIGAPGENNDRGRITVLRGAKDGWTARGAYAFGEATSGVPGTPHKGDRFGEALSALDVAGTGRADLLVGSPGAGPGSGRGSVALLVTTKRSWHGDASRLLTANRLGVLPADDRMTGFGRVIGGLGQT